MYEVLMYEFLMDYGGLLQGRICKESNRASSSQFQKGLAMRDMKTAAATVKNTTLATNCHMFCC
jgi:hypothetical protein